MNAIMMIKPYFDGTWVFDDEEVGLRKEPFVCGVPEVLSMLVEDIPDADNGFNMYFSANEFPGYQAKAVRKTEPGMPHEQGTVYKIEVAGMEMEGWLCPALFKYFAEAPENIYVKAEARDVSKT